MNESTRYVKVVEWSDEDRCFIGSAPGLVFGGCHGADEKAVFAELYVIVDEIIESHKRHGDDLPPPTIGKAWDLLVNEIATEQASDSSRAA